MHTKIAGIAIAVALTTAALAGCSSTTSAVSSPSKAAAPVSTSASPIVKAPAAPKKAAAPSLTVSQEQALIAAKGYLADGSGFSYQGLIDQLDSSAGNGFSVADATAAVNSLNADYNAQAAIAAKAYAQDGSGFSRASMIAQLDSPDGNKFTPAQAAYGATAAGL